MWLTKNRQRDLSKFPIVCQNGGYQLNLCTSLLVNIDEIFRKLKTKGKQAIVLFIGKQNYGKSSYDYHPSLIVFVDDITSYDDIA